MSLTFPWFRRGRAVVLSFCAVLLAFAGAAAQEENVEITILADQVRSQGHACSTPVSTERIAAELVPEEPAYVLKCENATYQIRLIPDQAAKVTRIE